MENGGEIEIELFPTICPNTVASVIHLAKQGLYDNRRFYRIVKDFVIQTGCEKTQDLPGCDYIIDGEYKNSGHLTVQHPFVTGSVGMAGLGKNSNVSDGSSFFICTAPAPSLEDNFANIGKVIKGLDVVFDINDTPCDSTMYKNIAYYQPITQQVMKAVTVETFGVTYPAPMTKPPNEEYLAMELELKTLRKDIF